PVGDLAHVLCAVPGHGEAVRQDLGGMKLVGQTVPHGDTGKFSEDLNGVLRIAPVFDSVEGPAEYAGRVFHGLFMSDLGAARLEVGDVTPLVMRRDFECRPGAGG